MDTEGATSSHRCSSTDNNVAAQPTNDLDAATSASYGNDVSCNHKQSTAASPAPPSCICSAANLLRIDKYHSGLHVDIHRGLFSTNKLGSSDDGNNWYQQLLTNVRWHRVKYKSNRFQKDCETPCWTAFYGGRSEYRPYTPVPAWFQPLVDQVTSHLGNGAVFNTFLLRLYFDGNDEIAWHTDGRKFLGEEPTIASLSFGCKATFQLRRMNNVWPCADGSKSTEGCVDINTPVESFVLNDGDLLVMRGKTQKHWHHRVPKEKGRRARLNINFRYVMPGLDAESGQRTYYKYMVYGDCPMDSQPRSWTFDEILAKRGGMMNFVQRGIKRKSAEVGVKKVDGQSAEVPTEVRNLKKSIHHADSDTEQYLTSEQSIDPEVFMSLPIEIQRELVSEWRSQQTTQSTIIPNGLNARKKESDRSTPNAGNNTKPSFRKGTLDSFFAKKG
ncbi:hypothetical protein ACHAXR_007015 [Thalassiosira sp. AJA248-18]